ncbi:MAG: HNH endonuclease [Bacteroidota bacterium]
MASLIKMDKDGNIIDSIDIQVDGVGMVLSHYLDSVNADHSTLTFTISTTSTQIPFLNNPLNKPTVDHIDRNKFNTHIDNLRWATLEEQSLNKLQLPILNEEQLAIFDNRIANELPKGYASFHHPLTMHGSYSNYSESPRRATVINTMDHLTLGNLAGYERLDALASFPEMIHDKPLDSQFFPLLFDGDKKLEKFPRNIPMINS